MHIQQRACAVFACVLVALEASRRLHPTPSRELCSCTLWTRVHVDIAKIAGQGLRPGLAPGSLGPALPRGDRVQPCSEGRGSAPVNGMHMEGKGWHRGKGSDDHGDDTETHGPPIDVQTGLVMDAAVAVCLAPRGRVQHHCDPNGSCCWKHTRKNKSTQYPCSVCRCIGVVNASRKLCKLCCIAESQKQNWSEPRMAPAKHAAQVPGARSTSACRFVVCWCLGSEELRCCPRRNFWQNHIDQY